MLVGLWCIANHTQSSYFNGVITEDLDCLESDDTLYEAVGELLIGYDLVADEEAAMTKCKELRAELRAAGVACEGAAEEQVLLAAPVVMKSTETYVNPLDKMPSALQMGQHMMKNTSEGLPEAVTLNTSKAQAKRDAKERRLRMENRTWDVKEGEQEKEKALQIYLDACQSPALAPTDLTIPHYTMNRPGKTTPLLEDTTLRLIAGRRYGLM